MSAAQYGQHKCVMVIDGDLPLGLIANTAAVLALSLGARIPLLGPEVVDGSGSPHAGITTTPIPILKGEAEKVRDIRAQAAGMGEMFVVDITNAAQTTRNYEDYTAKLCRTTESELRYLGVAIYGPKKAVSRLTGNLPLMA
ncbi:MAG: DUF2000 domain-containing protein [Thermaerobacter sp.]|jgi:hypothetical protein|nr:DUF2000 domain-containing protein [Thermaerobacter sp.]